MDYTIDNVTDIAIDSFRNDYSDTDYSKTAKGRLSLMITFNDDDECRYRIDVPINAMDYTHEAVEGVNCMIEQDKQDTKNHMMELVERYSDEDRMVLAKQILADAGIATDCMENK